MHSDVEKRSGCNADGFAVPVWEEGSAVLTFVLCRQGRVGQGPSPPRVLKSSF